MIAEPIFPDYGLCSPRILRESLPRLLENGHAGPQELFVMSNFLRQLASSVRRTEYTLSSGASLQGALPVPGGVSVNTGGAYYTVQSDDARQSQLYLAHIIGAGIGLPGINIGGSGGPSSLPSAPGRLYSLPGSMGRLNAHSLAGTMLLYDVGTGGIGMGVGGTLVFLGGGGRAQQVLMTLLRLHTSLGTAAAPLIPPLLTAILACFQAVTTLAGFNLTLGTPGVSISHGSLLSMRDPANR